ncbi:MAG: carbohydrate ABC transporter permease [Treponema sp.]|nr:carbohydrate ABC transporter permease [Treponema sp.]MBR4004808.1 carbohydrate ABC transporter permease [Treponema sp.]
MKNYQVQKSIKSTIIYIFMIVFALIAIVPVWVLLINATRSTAQINKGLSIFPSIHAFSDWTDPANGVVTKSNWYALTSRNFQIAHGFRNSLIVSGLSTILNVYFSALTAYAIHVYRFKGRKILWGVIMTLIMLPASLSFIGFYQFMAKIHLTNTYIPLIVPAMAAAGTVLFIKQYLESVLSLELIEASRIDGAGEFLIFNRIIIPVIKPALATQAIFAFVASWNNFMTPFVLLSKTEKYTLPMLVQMLRGDIYRTEYGGIYLGIAISLVPIIIFYCFMSKFIISGLTMGSVKE